MRIVAVYNMKGGVGKTTATVNLSYCAASSGHRTLLWDLDPQAASSFAFRVRPRVSGFGKHSLEDGEALGAAIKETDYQNLHLLPADFAYRKFERFMDSLGKPECLMRSLLDRLGRDFDVVFLDCPAGFSLLIEGVLAAADAVLVPTNPTVLSLRTVARLIKCAGRSDSQAELVAFLSMVDRRKALHRRVCEWSAAHSEFFLSGQIPYASVVEQMAVRRMPLAAFAPHDSAATAFAEIWTELHGRLQENKEKHSGLNEKRVEMLRAVESLIAQLESPDRPAPGPPGPETAVDVSFVHRFDTAHRDLERSGHVVELCERVGSLLVVAAQSGSDEATDVTRRAQAQIDGSWALQILSGQMSPLTALDRKFGRPGPHPVENIRTIVGGRRLERIDTQVARDAGCPASICCPTRIVDVRAAAGQTTSDDSAPRPEFPERP